ncbi:MAG: acyl-CoA dehydrogenase family protein [Terrimesophilobacter sp.]
MKFEFTQEHDALRGLLADVCGQGASTRTVYDTGMAIDTPLWDSLGAAGLLGVGAPERYEGGDAGPVEQVLIAEALGRVVGAVPFSEHTAATEVVMLLGSDDQRRRLLPPLTRGEAVAGIVLPDRAALSAVEARRDGSRWRLDGRVPLIPNAAAATVLAVPALVDEQVSWFATTAADISALPTVDRSRPAAAAEFSSAGAELLHGGQVSERPRDLLLTLAAAEAAGAASTALESTARYTTERHQFGLPIGTFQAVKHRLADMLVAVENCRSGVYGAAWALLESDSPGLSVALAQAVATANAVTVISDAVQLHGGIGVTWECDLHLLLRRAKALEATYGSPGMHRARIAAGLLGD